jgi:hypothetical protein
MRIVCPSYSGCAVAWATIVRIITCLGIVARKSEQAVIGPVRRRAVKISTLPSRLWREFG